MLLIRKRYHVVERYIGILMIFWLVVLCIVVYKSLKLCKLCTQLGLNMNQILTF